MVDYEEKEPTGQTCPDINRTQKKLDKAIELIHDFQKKCKDFLHPDLITELEDVADVAEDVSDNDLENLRDKNSALRDWGNGLVEACKEFENVCKNLSCERDEYETSKFIIRLNYLIVHIRPVYL